MTNSEKKQLRTVISQLNNSLSIISSFTEQEQDRLDLIENSMSQFDRATKLENNIESLENAEDDLSNAISSLEQII